MKTQGILEDTFGCWGCLAICGQVPECSSRDFLQQFHLQYFGMLMLLFVLAPSQDLQGPPTNKVVMIVEPLLLQGGRASKREKKTCVSKHAINWYSNEGFPRWMVFAVSFQQGPPVSEEGSYFSREFFGGSMYIIQPYQFSWTKCNRDIICVCLNQIRLYQTSPKKRPQESDTNLFAPIHSSYIILSYILYFHDYLWLSSSPFVSAVSVGLLAIAEVQGLSGSDIHLRSQLPHFWVLGGWWFPGTTGIETMIQPGDERKCWEGVWVGLGGNRKCYVRCKELMSFDEIDNKFVQAL